MIRPGSRWRRAGGRLTVALAILAAGAIAVRGGPAREIGLTDEEREWLQQNPDKLTLFYDMTFPPLEFGNETGDFTGMGADVCARIEQMLGVQFVRKPSRDWTAHLKKLQSGECAIAPTIAWAAGREDYVLFTKPYLLVPAVIITSQGREGFRSVDELAGRRVGVVAGFTTEQYMREQAKRIRMDIVAVPDVPAGLQGVAFGEFDAFVENLAVAAYFIDTLGIPKLRVTGKTDYVFDFRMGVSRRYPLLFHAIRKALDALDEHELAAIRSEWISLDAEPGLDAETRRLLWLAGWFLVLLVAGLAGINYGLKKRLVQRVGDLRESEARYRRLVQNSPAVVYQFTRSPGGDYAFSYISENSEPLTGVDPQEALRDYRVMLERIHPDDRERIQVATEESARNLAPFQCTFRYRMRTREAWIECRARPTRLPDGGVSWDGLFLNVTGRKRAAEALRTRESYLNAIIENQPGLVWLKDADGRFLAVNTAFARACGRESPDQVQGKTDLDVWPRELAENYIADDRRILQSGQGTVVEEPIHAGGQTRWFETIKQPVRDTNGAILGTTGYALDTTERKRAQAERERLEAQLAQAQKMDSIGQLAGGVAHDFNNMLGVILGNTELAIESTPPDMPLYGELVEIRKAAERSAALTRQLLAFARKQTVAPRVLALNDTVESMLHMLQRLIGEEIEVDWHPGAGAGQVRMDPTQIDQLLVNLCVNARDAIGGPGRIVISTGSSRFEDQDCAAFAGAVPGTYSWLAVQDNGRGMDAGTLQHIFEPFFTTKGVGKGTGLGLATVYGIIKQNDGFIGVDSTPGKGTTFTLHLPRHDAAPPVPAERPRPSGEASRRTILLVEDEPAILHMVRTLLEHQGFAVLATESPAEAVSIAERHPGGIDLLLSDVVMPGLNGRDLARRLAEIRPDLRCVFMSGHAANILVREGALANGVHFVHKPFTAAALIGKIRHVLEDA